MIFKNSLSKFENGDEAFDTLLGFVELDAYLYVSTKGNKH